MKKHQFIAPKSVVLLVIPIVIQFLIGCGTNDRNLGLDSGSGDSKEVVQKISQQAKIPDVGDFRELEYLQFHELAGQSCIYIVTENTSVTQVTESLVEHTYDRKFIADRNNSAACPAQHPEFVAHEVKSWGIGRYPQMQLEAIASDLDPAVYQKNKWVQTASLGPSQEVTRNGLRAQQVDMKVVSKSGVEFNYRQFVSYDSLFLARFEYSRTRTDNGTSYNYRILKKYSIKKLRPNP